MNRVWLSTFSWGLRHALIDNSFLSEVSKARYRQKLDDRLLALGPHIDM